MKVLGTELYIKGIDTAVQEFNALAQKDSHNFLVNPADANVLVHARRNHDFAAILNASYWNLPDGVPSVWILKLKGAKNVNRCSGPDFFERVIRETSQLPINHFLCGGAEGTAKELAQQCLEWGNSNIVGYHCPPFKTLSKEDYQEMAAKINASKTNVLWVGLGAPKQIYFSHEIAKYSDVQFIVPIGAAFDFHTGKVRQSPKWIQKIGMEWFYRLLQEPRRLGKRYFKVVPLFIWYNFLGLFKRDRTK